MSLLDLTDKKDWDAFAAKECIALDSNGGVDAKETQVRLVLLCIAALVGANQIYCSKRDLQRKLLSMKVRGDNAASFIILINPGCGVEPPLPQACADTRARARPQPFESNISPFNAAPSCARRQ